MTITVSSAPAGTITVQPGDRTPASIVIKSYNIENVTTSEIQEGVNLYFSNARVYSNVISLGYITSSALSGYATNAQLATYATTTNVALKANIVDLTTANVTEVTNQYFTNSRAVAAVVNTTLSNITVSGNITGNTNGFAIGYLNIPQVTASNVTLALTDAGKHYYSTTAGSLTLTIPTNANVAFATGTAISIVVQAAGNVLVNAAGGVTLYMAGNSTAANRVVSTYGMATLMKVATDTWFINGTGVS
jgi:hypothetical protein